MGLEKRRNPTRRNVLGGLIGAAVGIEIANKLLPSDQGAPAPPLEPDETPPETEAPPMRQFSFLADEKGEIEHIPAGALAGHKVADLNAAYLGLPDTPAARSSTVPSLIAENFPRQLSHLWKRKIAFAVKNDSDLDSEQGIEAAYKKAPELFALAERLYETYDSEAEHATLPEYEAEAGRAATDVHRDLETALRAGAPVMSLHDDQKKFLLEASRLIGGKELMAYALTELMPSHDGAFNALMMDFLLRHGGKGFVERIPAVYDRAVSFGPYQMTPSALDAATNAGASAIARFLPEHAHVPDRVENLEGIQHHKAAYLFALYNISHLARELDGAALSSSGQHIARSPIDIVMFVAVAHHMPNAAVHAFKHFAERLIEHDRIMEKLTSALSREERIAQAHGRALLSTKRLDLYEKELRRAESTRPTFQESLESPALKLYAEKTLHNFRALP